jgi:hypothetical protein
VGPKKKAPKQLSLRGIGPKRELLSRRAYARLRGVSEMAVRRALKDGRITAEAGGKIAPVRADRQWFATTDTSKPRNSITGDPKHRRAADEPETPMGMGEMAGKDSQTTEHLRQFAQARAAREAVKAKIEHMTLQRLEGTLIDVDQVRAAAYSHTRSARDQLLSIPDRLAPLLAVMSDPAEIHRALSEELRRVAVDLSRPILTEAQARGGKA